MIEDNEPSQGGYQSGKGKEVLSCIETSLQVGLSGGVVVGVKVCLAATWEGSSRKALERRGTRGGSDRGCTGQASLKRLTSLASPKPAFGPTFGLSCITTSSLGLVVSLADEAFCVATLPRLREDVSSNIGPY